MGSEGYLINQFLCKVTNKRTDEYAIEQEKMDIFKTFIPKNKSCK